jgi:hypothetical protein
MVSLIIAVGWVAIGALGGYLLSYPGSPWADGDEWKYAAFGAILGPVAMLVWLIEQTER